MTTHDQNARDMHRARRKTLRRLVQTREMSRYTAADIANKIGVPECAVHRFERELENADPTLDMVLRYADAIGSVVTLELRDRDSNR